MTDGKCPWCEVELVLRITNDAQTCPECLTTWIFEDADEPVELALAA